MEKTLRENAKVDIKYEQPIHDLEERVALTVATQINMENSYIPAQKKRGQGNFRRL